MSNLPTELIRDIALYVLDDFSANKKGEQTGTCLKPPWQLAASFSLASRTFRGVILELWFRTLYVESPRDIEEGCSLFPEIAASWTRKLHCVQPADAAETYFWDIDGLTKLKSIRYDWLQKNRSPVDSSALQWPTVSAKFPFSERGAANIVELDIRGIQWPSPLLLMSLAISFSQLSVLMLRQSRIWCALCNTCTTSRFQETPPTIVYTDGLGLPVHYNRALAPLTQLTEVYLTIADLAGGSTTLGPEEGQNPHMWAGECNFCMTIMYCVPGFVENWVKKKHDSAEGPDGPPLLKRVEWNFWRIEIEEEEDENDSIGTGSE